MTNVHPFQTVPSLLPSPDDSWTPTTAQELRLDDAWTPTTAPGDAGTTTALDNAFQMTLGHQVPLQLTLVLQMTLGH